jgi:hypothetical protein
VQFFGIARGERPEHQPFGGQGRECGLGEGQLR